jgi:PhnB protein
MPLAPAFWAKTFGMLTDRFGVSWGVNGEPDRVRLNP